ncbi:hypothetical protein RZS08_36460, partial [Arthrospira platensis SPKY1]|nr:hypothetical protein [Arthrospira platensis SPKY1]
IRNTSIIGNAVNQFFPTMMKTRINYTSDVASGRSIYDYFANPDLFDTQLTYSKRHFKRDSFYHYSIPVKKFTTTMDLNEYKKKYLFVASDGVEWIKNFEENRSKYPTYDYWLQAKEDDDEYT